MSARPARRGAIGGAAHRLAVLAALLAAALVAGGVAARATAEPWHLVVDLSSFQDGHIATFDRVIEVKDGSFDGSFRQGASVVALTFHVSAGAVTGDMAVVADEGWNGVTIKYQGPLVHGVFAKELVGPATYSSGVLRKNRNVSRNVDVTLRLERR